VPSVPFARHFLVRRLIIARRLKIDNIVNNSYDKSIYRGINVEGNNSTYDIRRWPTAFIATYAMIATTA
jgi:hypothetical protein